MKKWLKESGAPLYEKVLYTVGICCLDRKTELHNLNLSDITIISSRETSKDEVVVDLSRLKADGNSGDQSTTTSDDLFTDPTKRCVTYCTVLRLL